MPSPPGPGLYHINWRALNIQSIAHCAMLGDGFKPEVKWEGYLMVSGKHRAHLGTELCPLPVPVKPPPGTTPAKQDSAVVGRDASGRTGRTQNGFSSCPSRGCKRELPVQ